MNLTSLRRILVCLIAATSLGCDERAEDGASDAATLASTLVQQFELSGFDGTESGFTKPIARELPDGSIIVADQAEVQLTLFDPTGALQREFPVKGSGPGEIEAPFTITLIGDTVIMLHAGFGGARASWIVPSRGARGAVTLPRNGGPSVLSRAFEFKDRFPDGAWLVTRGSSIRALDAPFAIGERSTDSITLGALQLVEPANDPAVRWLPTRVRATTLAFEWPGGPIPTNAMPYVFLPGLLYTASGDNLWIMDPMSGQGERWHGGSRVSTFNMLRRTPSTIDVAEVQRVGARLMQVARRPLDSSRIAANYDPANLPDSAPYASKLIPSHDGTVWVEVFHVDSAAAPEYVALDPMGVEMRTIRTPAGVQLQFVGRTHVLGVRRDEDGLEYVVVLSAPARE